MEIVLRLENVRQENPENLRRLEKLRQENLESLQRLESPTVPYPPSVLFKRARTPRAPAV